MNKLLSFFGFLAILVFWPNFVDAYQISVVSGTAVSGDFVLGQAKNEVVLKPGESKTREIYVLNRSGQELKFVVGVENFISPDQGQEAIVFTNNQDSIYPAESFLIPEVSKFSLKHGEKIALPISIKVAGDVSPGGLYGAVTVAVEPDNGSSRSQVKTTSQLASLFFIRVSGDVYESGYLEKFSSLKKFYQPGSIDLFFNFKNDGNIYLNPHGTVTITNLFGQVVEQKIILPYFVMPGAIRQQKEVWQASGRRGVYWATIELSRGYGDKIDRQSISLFILSWLDWLSLLIVIACLIIFGVFIFKKNKQRNDNL